LWTWQAQPAAAFRLLTCGGFFSRIWRKCPAHSPLTTELACSDERYAAPLVYCRCRDQCDTYHGYSRANKWMYDTRAVCSSTVGFSGYRAIIVCSSFHEARPSSALQVAVLVKGSVYRNNAEITYLAVSFPSFGMMVSP
jgi:hypothetical protein